MSAYPPFGTVLGLVTHLCLLILSSPHAAPPTKAISLLQGEQRLACETILCLSSQDPPHQCDPALAHYYSIRKRKFWRTLDARKDFLQQCPASDDSSEMGSLVDAIARGAGRCDAKTLNAILTDTFGDEGVEVTITSDQLPSYCQAYLLHAYTDLQAELPKYVGTPREHGFWADAKDYPAALKRYTRLQVSRKAAQKSFWEGE